ncbi:hypothetical protein ACHQM5_027614 [Ranunculus cassubicifolius]
MIPHELVVEILTWLPAIHLWPLRCVNKTWFNLLTTDSNFAKLHFNRSISNPSIIAKTSSGKANFHLATDYTACNESINLGFPFEEGEAYYSLIGISNGLICILHMTRNHVYIWNPIIKDQISIKYPPSPAYFGFGFHQDSNAYKVVKIVPRNALHVSVWTLGVDSSWRDLEVDNECKIHFVISMPSPIVNGCIHWLAIKGPSYMTIILSFDMKDEVIAEIALPIEVSLMRIYDDNCLEIMEIGGCLCICCYSAENQILQIWEMKDYGDVSSWRKLELGRPEVGDLVSFALQLKPRGLIARTGEIMLQKTSRVIKGELSPDMRRQLILYNFKTKLVTNLKEFGFEPCDVCVFVGSIISPRVISCLHNDVEDGE